MIKDYLNNRLTDKHKLFINWESEITQDMLDQLDFSVITADYGIGLPTWSEQNPRLVKDFTYLMYKLNLGIVESRRNYARFQFNMTVLDPKEVLEYRSLSKIDRMLMKEDVNTYPNNLVKRPSGICEDGVPRPGMALAAKRQFKLDTKLLAKYFRPIKQNVIKSIKKGIDKGTISSKFFADEASYRIVAEHCLVNYLDPNATYNSEVNFQDQRARAVKKILKRVGNYIANKDFRAMLVMPTPDKLYFNDTDALDSIFLFVAELTGHKCLGQMETDKIEAGRQAYLGRELPKLNLKDENDRKALHELIWLERIYARLDTFYAAQKSKLCKTDYITWDIPVEIDHSMSMAQIMGALTNDIRILESTNMVDGPIQDPWYIENVRRDVAKAVYTPKLYGSGRSATSLVKGKNLFRTQLLELAEAQPSKIQLLDANQTDKAELKALKQVEREGRFHIMLALRDLFITNSNVATPVIGINTGISNFSVHVSKTKVAGHDTVVTEAYNGKTFKYSFTKQPIRVPDYAAMRTFWHTCLIHHLDSDLMDHNLISNPHLWALDIHDAIICSPVNATTFRKTAAARLEYYRNNRHSIIANYRKSIGATSPKADIAYMNLLKVIKDAGDIPFSKGCMK